MNSVLSETNAASSRLLISDSAWAGVFARSTSLDVYILTIIYFFFPQKNKKFKERIENISETQKVSRLVLLFKI